MLPKLEVVTETTIQHAIADLTKKVDEVMVAVSYVGTDGDQFFPEKGRPPRMFFLVDMSQQTVACGLTNPTGVSKLLHLGSVRSLAGLHSKVFIFGEESAIVGSANLSANSIENQFQCGLITNDRKAIKELRNWFRFMWTTGSKITFADCTAAQVLFPQRHGKSGLAKRKHMVKIKRWRAPILEPIEFEIGLTKADTRRARTLFKTSPCGYREELTCEEGAERRAKQMADCSRELRSLVKRIKHWNKDDREELFALAFIDGAAAQIGKPQFLRQPASRVRDAMEFLFFGEGDDHVRFEQVAAIDGRFRLERLGRAGVATLMHLWSPKEHGIWNDSVDRGLRLLKVKFNRTHSRHISQAYMDRSGALKAIMIKFGLRSLAKTDHFVDAFGKGHLKL